MWMWVFRCLVSWKSCMWILVIRWRKVSCWLRLMFWCKSFGCRWVWWSWMFCVCNWSNSVLSWNWCNCSLIVRSGCVRLMLLVMMFGRLLRLFLLLCVFRLKCCRCRLIRFSLVWRVIRLFLVMLRFMFFVMVLWLFWMFVRVKCLMLIRLC